MSSSSLGTRIAMAAAKRVLTSSITFDIDGEASNHLDTVALAATTLTASIDRSISPMPSRAVAA